MAGRKAARRKTPMDMWFDMTAMALDASFVIPLRLAKIAAGGAAGTREANGMVTEKLLAANRAAITMMTGGEPETILRITAARCGRTGRRLSKN